MTFHRCWEGDSTMLLSVHWMCKVGSRLLALRRSMRWHLGDTWVTLHVKLSLWEKNDVSLSLFVVDRLAEETDQSSLQTGKHFWKVVYNGVSPSDGYTQTHAQIKPHTPSHTLHLLHSDTNSFGDVAVQSALFLISISFSLTSFLYLSPSSPPLLLPFFLSTPHVKVTAEELSGNDDYIELCFSARKLDDKVSAILCVLSERLNISCFPLDVMN